MSLIYIIEDEPIMADCIAAAIAGVAPAPMEMEIFNNAITAMQAVNERLPDVILLDVMLTGPDGFAFLNEMISYHDTARIPVILITSLDLSHRNLAHYGVVSTLNKATMTPEDIYAAIESALSSRNAPAEAPLDVPKAAPPELPASIADATSTVVPANTPVSLDDFKQKLAASQEQDPPHAQ